MLIIVGPYDDSAYRGPSDSETGVPKFNLRPAKLVVPGVSLKKRLQQRAFRRFLYESGSANTEDHSSDTVSLGVEDDGPFVQVEIEGDAPPHIRQLFAGIERFRNVAVYVHGSWADSTTTPFSDLDDLVIVNVEHPISLREIWGLERTLNRIDMRFMRLDPIQHHGHWILEAGNWSAPLDESFIPLVVLEGALRVQGPSTVASALDRSATELGLARNIELSCQTIENVYADYLSRTANIYAIKQLVGSILLMPAYVMQSRGRRVGKREAIEGADELFSPEALATVRWASSVRESWGSALGVRGVGTWRSLSRLPMSPRIFRRLVSRYAPQFPVAAFDELATGAVTAFLKESRSYISLEHGETSS